MLIILKLIAGVATIKGMVFNQVNMHGTFCYSILEIQSIYYE